MYSHVEGDESVEVVYLVDWLDLMHKQYLSKGHAEFNVWLNKLESTYEVWSSFRISFICAVDFCLCLSCCHFYV